VACSLSRAGDRVYTSRWNGCGLMGLASSGYVTLPVGPHRTSSRPPYETHTSEKNLSSEADGAPGFQLVSATSMFIAVYTTAHHWTLMAISRATDVSSRRLLATSRPVPYFCSFRPSLPPPFHSAV
jgi:hypothetical protein